MLSIRDSHRWALCSASGAETDYLLPAEPLSELALEGVAMRWAADCLLYGDATSPEELAGHCTPEGYVVTAEIANYANEYAAGVSAANSAMRGDLVIAGKVGGPHDTDISDDRHVLRVCMPAMGRKLVDVTAEPRLLLPAIAATRQEHEGAELWVFQPRSFHPDGPWRHVAYERAGMIAAAVWVGQKVLEIETPGAPATVGNQCTACRRRSRCIALTAAAYQDSDTIEHRGAGRGMTAQELGAELTFLDAAQERVRARWTGVRAEGDARARDGEFIPGWHLPEPHGRRELALDPAVVSFVTGCPATKQAARSPAEMERDGVSKQLMKKLTRARPGHATLTPVDPTIVKRSFKDVKGV